MVHNFPPPVRPVGRPPLSAQQAAVPAAIHSVKPSEYSCLGCGRRVAVSVNRSVKSGNGWHCECPYCATYHELLRDSTSNSGFSIRVIHQMRVVPAQIHTRLADNRQV